MPRLVVFDKDEIKAFDSPPVFLTEHRDKYFSLSEKLLLLIKKITSPTNKICLIIQWGYFRATGRFFSPKYFRKSDIAYVADLFDISLSEINIDHYYNKRKTSREHEKSILLAMKFTAFDENTKNILYENIKRLVEKQVQPREIIYHIASQLHQQKIEIPGYYTFVENITLVYNQFEDNLLNIINRQITPDQITKLNLLVDAKEESGYKSLLTEWKTINQSMKVRDIQENIELFKKIKSYFNAFLPLLNRINLSAQACEYYATWVKKAKISQIKQFPKQTKTYLHLIAFIQYQFYFWQDTLIDILLKSVQATRNKAVKKILSLEHDNRKERLALIEQVVDEQDKLENLVFDITKIVNAGNISDTDKITEIKQLLYKNDVIQNNSEQEKSISKSQLLRKLMNEDSYYDCIEGLSIKLQRRVTNIIKHIEFNHSTSDTVLIEAINYFKTNDGNIGNDSPINFMDAKQQKVVYDENNEIKISLYKAFLFISIANGIKSCHLNLQYSYRYKAIQDYLISQDSWNKNKDGLLDAAGLKQFRDVDIVLNQLKLKINERYHHVNQRINNNENSYVSFDQEGHFTVTTPKLEKANNESLITLFSETGSVPIIKILRDIDVVTQFTKVFKQFSTKNHKLKPSVEIIIAGIMAHGHNIGINKIGNISVGINSNTLRQTVNWFFIAKNMKIANNKIIALINRLSLSRIFKYNSKITHTSSDGRKVNVAVDSLLANYSFKYFGKDMGVSIYVFIDDNQSLFYSTVISASEREAAYVIDGLLHNDVVKSTIHSTDTHGFTESVFAAAHFIGISFAPRFKKLSTQRIYGFSSPQTYKNNGFKILPSRTINTNLIRAHWDDILRFMVTIKLKETTASQLFKRLSSYAKDHPLYKAIKEFGRIVKTQFILTYIDDVDLRQRMEQQLNRVELSNKFSKAVFFANNQEFQYGEKGEQEIVTACKVLIQNAIVLWNYLYLSQILATNANPHERGIVLNSIKWSSMMSWQHINMQGEYDFTKHNKSTNVFDMDKILSLKVDAA